MKFYYVLGVCLFVVYIIFNEINVDFDLVWVDLKIYKIEKGVDYYEINLKGYVFVLEINLGLILIENVVILLFLV